MSNDASQEGSYFHLKNGDLASEKSHSHTPVGHRSTIGRTSRLKRWLAEQNLIFDRKSQTLGYILITGLDTRRLV
jgi:hypothetical protein